MHHYYVMLLNYHNDMSYACSTFCFILFLLYVYSQDVDGLSDDSPRVKVVTGELLEEEEGVIVSSHDSHSQELSQDPSTIPHLSKG